jgi:hypothetical protein
MKARPVYCILLILLLSVFLTSLRRLAAEEIPVHHIEGTSLGFLVLRDENGSPIAYGDLQQVVTKNYVMDDMKFKFNDGSFYEEITKFTQHKVFHLVSDQVVQRGPSFKQQMECLIDTASGNVTVSSKDEKGKEKKETKHLNLPSDLANGLLMTIAKNLDPSAPSTTVSMVAGSSSPQIVKVKYSPQPEAIFHVGPMPYKSQHYLVKIEITGLKGKVAPLVGKQPKDIDMWLAKSESPTFLKFRGQMYEDGPIWEMELAAPRDGAPAEKEK